MTLPNVSRASLPLAFHNRREQVELMADRWATTKRHQAFGDATREAIPSLFRAMTDAIKTGRHREVGGLLHNIVARSWDLVDLIVDENPTHFQASMFCSLLHLALEMWSPGFDTQDVDFEEVLNWVASDAASEFRCPGTTLGYNLVRGLLFGLRSTLREELTYCQHWQLISGYEHANRRSTGLTCPPWLLEMREPPTPESLEDRYRNIGQPIDMAMFCEPTSSVPADVTCPICIDEVTAAADESGQQPVVTTCGHHFHRQCLDDWVNDSAMSKSNTCPSCRAVMCMARPRIPANTPPLNWEYNT